MKALTKLFGEVNIEDDKIINFPSGIVGFPDLTDFAIIFDSDQGDDVALRWLQSMQEPAFAMPIMNPLIVRPDYDPEVDDELLEPLGPCDVGNQLVFVTVTVPSDPTKMTVNLRAPIVINAGNRNAVQIIVEGDEYPIKFPIYEVLRSMQPEAQSC